MEHRRLEQEQHRAYGIVRRECIKILVYRPVVSAEQSPGGLHRHVRSHYVVAFGKFGTLGDDIDRVALRRYTQIGFAALVLGPSHDQTLEGSVFVEVVAHHILDGRQQRISRLIARTQRQDFGIEYQRVVKVVPKIIYGHAVHIIFHYLGKAQRTLAVRNAFVHRFDPEQASVAFDFGDIYPDRVPGIDGTQICTRGTCQTTGFVYIWMFCHGSISTGRMARLTPPRLCETRCRLSRVATRPAPLPM